MSCRFAEGGPIPPAARWYRIWMLAEADAASSIVSPPSPLHQTHQPTLGDSVDDLASGFGSRTEFLPRALRKGDDGHWRIAELRLTRLRIDQVAPTPPPAGTFPEPWHGPAPAAAGAPR